MLTHQSAIPLHLDQITTAAAAAAATAAAAARTMQRKNNFWQTENEEATSDDEQKRNNSERQKYRITKLIQSLSESSKKELTYTEQIGAQRGKQWCTAVETNELIWRDWKRNEVFYNLKTVKRQFA